VALKGCYVYFTDPETAEYFKSRLVKGQSAKLDQTRTPASVEARRRVDSDNVLPDNVLPFRSVDREKAKPYVNAVPLVDLKFAAGAFGGTQFNGVDHDEWAILPGAYRPGKGMFVAQVIGESMNRIIPNGAWCLFRSNPVGTRNGKVVVAQHRSIHDPETGGSYTVKRYQSKKENRDDGSWRHLEIRLRPESDVVGFENIVFGPEDAESVQIVAELIAEL